MKKDVLADKDTRKAYQCGTSNGFLSMMLVEKIYRWGWAFIISTPTEYHRTSTIQETTCSSLFLGFIL